jgi:hypothetical protein
MFNHTSSVFALLVFALVAPALGQGPGRDGRLGPNPLKDRQCLHECRREELACLKAAREAAAPCFAGCKELIDAAHEACAADPQSEACQEAAAAARACLGPCYDQYRPAARECKAEGKACARACPFLGERPCVARCRAAHAHCVADARAALIECRRDCDDEALAARVACADDPDSAACEAAREALHACLAPCRAGLQHDLDECGDTRRECVQECGDDGATSP